MTPTKDVDENSVFGSLGFVEGVDAAVAEVAKLYLEDPIPWVVGYSGGKDSTATLALVWLALLTIDSDRRTKPVYVISNDTLVENPVVSSWVERSVEAMAEAAKTDGLPIEAHLLHPAVDDTFWVNLIGKGYPAPRHSFRWCTDRLKITPANRFIKNVVRSNGEAIVILGARKAESQTRAKRMKELEQRQVRSLLTPNDSLPNALVYTPISDWTNDDVWLFLMQTPNPWGYDNKALLAMYRGASADNECPLVVDTSTPSCGDSRFGCWVCTLVEKDKSMSAMIQNDSEKRWMLPLLELRDAFKVGDDRDMRDFRRLTGRLHLFPNGESLVHGPYTQEIRAEWLRRLLEAQTWIRANGGSDVTDIELITEAEIHEIRRIWVFDKHETEDLAPQVYQEATGEEFPGPSFAARFAVQPDDLAELEVLCDEDPLMYEMTRNLIDVAQGFRTQTRRSGLLEELASTIEQSWYEDEADALDWARQSRLTKRGRVDLTDAAEIDAPEISETPVLFGKTVS